MSASPSNLPPAPAASAAGASFRVSRRTALAGIASSLAAAPALAGPAQVDLSPFRTPHKLGRLVLAKSGDPAAFDSTLADAPLVFRGPGRFYMAFHGFDGPGYQAGLAESDDLVIWRKRGLAPKPW